MKKSKVKAPVGYRFGKCRRFGQYCRMIRICVGSVADGEIFDGINTNTDEHEKCIVFKTDQKNKFDSICYDLISKT